MQASKDLAQGEYLELQVPIFNCGDLWIQVHAPPLRSSSPRPSWQDPGPELVIPVERSIEVFCGSPTNENLVLSTMPDTGDDQATTFAHFNINETHRAGYWTVRVTNRHSPRRGQEERTTFSIIISYRTALGLHTVEWNSPLLFGIMNDLWRDTQIEINRGAARVRFPNAYRAFGLTTITFPIPDFQDHFLFWDITEWPNEIFSTTKTFTPLPSRTLRFIANFSGTGREITGDFDIHLWNMVLTVDVPIMIEGGGLSLAREGIRASFDFRFEVYNGLDSWFNQDKVKGLFEGVATRAFQHSRIRDAFSRIADRTRPRCFEGENPESGCIPENAVLDSARIAPPAGGTPALFVTYYVPPEPPPSWPQPVPPL
jgi:hypothetical protein